jgi:hypothetical protein
MKLFRALSGVTVLLLSLSAISAEEKKTEMYVYATYFNCDPNLEDAVDEQVNKTYRPIYNNAAKNSTIANWGWLKHHTGGQWRRILYHSAPSVSALFSAQEQMNKEFDRAFGKNPDALGKGCKSHDDYIWQYVTGSRASLTSSPRGKASMSVYMECSFMGEDRADEIFKKHFAPIYNAQVGKGKLVSWGWMSHVIGGKYRRLETLSANNYEDLLKAKNSILDTLYYKGSNKYAEEFTKICTSHQDYLWDIDS